MTNTTTVRVDTAHTLYAQWTINQYTITFDSDGGTSISSITQNFGSNIISPSDPSKTGYTFQSWSPIVPSTMPAENITLTAQWTANIDWDLDIEISFRNIGTSSATRTSEYDFGTDLTGTDADTYIGDTIESIIYSYLGNSIDISSISYGIYYFDPLEEGSLETHSNTRYNVYTNISNFKVDFDWNINLVRITISYNDPV